MLRHEDRVDIIRQGVADLHDSHPDRQRFFCGEIGRSAFRHHPSFQRKYGDAEQAPEDARLPRMLRSRSIVGNFLGELVSHGEVVCEFLDENGKVIDMKERREQQGSKPSLDYRDASYRLLDPVAEIAEIDASPNGNNGKGPTPEVIPSTNDQPMFRQTQVLHPPPLEPRIDGFDPPA